MDLLTMVIVLIVVGILLWLVDLIPMDATIKRIIRILVIIVVVLWLLKAIGLFAYLSKVHI